MTGTHVNKKFLWTVVIRTIIKLEKDSNFCNEKIWNLYNINTISRSPPCQSSDSTIDIFALSLSWTRFASLLGMKSRRRIWARSISIVSLSFFMTSRACKEYNKAKACSKYTLSVLLQMKVSRSLSGLWNNTIIVLVQLITAPWKRFKSPWILTPIQRFR